MASIFIAERGEATVHYSPGADIVVVGTGTMTMHLETGEAQRLVEAITAALYQAEESDRA